VSIGKSVTNLISYLYEIFQKFSPSLAICFELFYFGEFVHSEIADSGPHLSAAMRRAGPTWQRAAAAWPPRAAPTPWLKAAVGTARRASRQLPRPRRARPTAAPLSVPPPSPRRAARVLTASRAPPSPRPSPRPRRPRPDRLANHVAVPTGASPVDAAPPSVVPALVSSCSSAASRASAPCHRRLAEQRRRALRHRAPCAALADRAGPHVLCRPRPSRAAPRVAVGRAAHCTSGPSAVSAQ
jgi:hypothetical protein